MLLFLATFIVIISTIESVINRRYTGIFLIDEVVNKEIEFQSFLSHCINKNLNTICDVNYFGLDEYSNDICSNCISTIRFYNILSKVEQAFPTELANDSSNNLSSVYINDRWFNLIHFQSSLDYFVSCNDDHGSHITMLLLVGDNMTLASILSVFLHLPESSIVYWITNSNENLNLEHLYESAKYLNINFRKYHFVNNSIFHFISTNFNDDSNISNLIIKVVDKAPFNYITAVLSELAYFDKNFFKYSSYKGNPGNTLKLNILISLKEPPLEESYYKKDWINDLVFNKSDNIVWEASGVDYFGEVSHEQENIIKLLTKSHFDNKYIFQKCPQYKDFLSDDNKIMSDVFYSFMGSYTLQLQPVHIQYYYNQSISAVDVIVDRMRRDNSFNIIPYEQIVYNNKRDDGNPLVILTFPYNGEPIAIIQLEYLYAFVDYFIIVEARVSFTGLLKKELYIKKNIDLFENLTEKIRFVVIDSFPLINEDFPYQLYRRYRKNVSDNESFGNSEKMTAMFREEYQRNVVVEYLSEHFYGNKYVLIVVDADEVINSESIDLLKGLYNQIKPAIYLDMDMFYYNFHWKKSSNWIHSFATTDLWIDKYTLSVMRTYNYERTCLPNAGWHCSYCLSLHEIIRKIESFSHTEFNNLEFKNIIHIRESILNGKDLFNREDDVNQKLIFSDISFLPLTLQRFHFNTLDLQQYSQSDHHQKNKVDIVLIITYSTKKSFIIANTMRELLLKETNKSCIVYLYNSNYFNMGVFGSLKEKHLHHDFVQVIFDFQEYYSLYLLKSIIIETRSNYTDKNNDLEKLSLLLLNNRYNYRKQLYVTSKTLFNQIKSSSFFQSNNIDLLVITGLDKTEDSIVCNECIYISVLEFYFELNFGNCEINKNILKINEISKESHFKHLNNDVFSFQKYLGGGDHPPIIITLSIPVVDIEMNINISLLRSLVDDEDLLFSLNFSLFVQQTSVDQCDDHPFVLFVDLNKLLINDFIHLEPIQSTFEYFSIFSAKRIVQDHLNLTFSLLRRNTSSSNDDDDISTTTVVRNNNKFRSSDIEYKLEIYNISFSHVPNFDNDISFIESKRHLNNISAKYDSTSYCDLLGMDDAAILNEIDISPYSLLESDNNNINNYPRVFCGVYTIDTFHQNKIKAQLDTWLWKCSFYLIFSNLTDISIPSVSVPHLGDESYRNMWQKVRSIWKFIYKHYSNDFDFFLLGGDDMYYIMENLYEFLNSDEIQTEIKMSNGLYIGKKLFHPEVKLYFNSGGCGYLLNKIALELLISNLNKSHCFPHLYDSREDLLIANCLYYSSENKIIPFETNNKFHSSSPGFQFRGNFLKSNLYKYDLEQKSGFDCCNKKSISFHLSVDTSLFPKYVYEINDFLYNCNRNIKNEFYNRNGYGFYDRYIKYSSEY